MGIKALEGLVPTWYTPEGQDKDDKPTRFKFCPLDGDQYAEVADHVALVNGSIRISALGQKICLSTALKGWENFEDSNGPIEFMPSNFRLIPYSDRVGLAMHIFTSSSLSGEQSKNSSSPSK